MVRAWPLHAPRLTLPEFSPRIIPAWRETRGAIKLAPVFTLGKSISSSDWNSLKKMRG
jgi:hypothetical protein